MEDTNKEASDYTKFMMKELKEMFKGEYKSPMQLPKEDKTKFFKHMDTAWKSKKESSTVESNDKTAKKVNEYFKFVQDQLKQNYPKRDIKSPLQITDKKERENFFSQVKQLWKKKGEKKEAALVTENHFKKFDNASLKEISCALGVARGQGKMVNKAILRRLMDAIGDALSTDKVKEEK